ncbi:MAG: hypothetical protein EON98_04205 [Chitinophagaceae bacterium]|nr:MAG: hypothetical protein EON98_04205 [Chitinophagaceae bacterium]
MGRLKRFNLDKLIAIADAKYLFETGTWKGDGLAYAAKSPFKKLYSSEIIDTVAEKAVNRFRQDGRIEIIHASSIDALNSHLSQLDGNCVFWLDAHFPGAEEGLKGYNEVEDEGIKLPLQKEMEIIATRKHKYQDVILVDDLRIYEEGSFDSGNLPDNVLPPKVRNTQFAETLFGDSHQIIKSFRDEGYLILIPKSVKQVSGFRKFLFELQNGLFKRII